MTTPKKRIKRTCSNCAAYLLEEGGLMACWNRVTIVIHHIDADGKPLTIKRLPGTRDWCENHQTHDEDGAKDAAMALLWQRLGVGPGKGRTAL